jgi:septum formation protein
LQALFCRARRIFLAGSNLLTITMKLILASASPRRAEILAGAGIEFEVRPANIEELRMPDESPEEMVERLARAKAGTVAREVQPLEPTIILSADTVVVVDAEIFGKPANSGDAREMLRKLRGREHDVVTGFAALRLPDRAIRSGSETTRVWFAPISDAEVDAYVSSGEPLDKAGSYAIQGLAGRYIPRVDGCYFNVVGLPLARIWQALKELGWPSR